MSSKICIVLHIFYKLFCRNFIGLFIFLYTTFLFVYNIGIKVRLYMTIMERIKKIMDEKNLTKADLVRLSGLKKPTIYRIFDESIDGSKIRIETLAPIAKALDVDLDYLLGKEPVNVPPSFMEMTQKIYEATNGARKQVEEISKILEKLPKLSEEQIYQLNLYIKLFPDKDKKEDTE